MTDWLAQIKARLEAATPGPWYSYGDELVARRDTNRDFSAFGNYREISVYGEDLEFIANAPTDIATLLKAIEVKDRFIKNILEVEMSWRLIESIGKEALEWTPEKDEKK